MFGKKRNNKRSINISESFLFKLNDILNDNNYKNFIHWDTNGKRVIILDVFSLCNIVLPKYYKHNNYSSFVRQLNIYGFHKSKGVENCGDAYETIELYKKNGGKILMSGDHKTDYYNEVYVMKNYAISRGVKSEDIFLDHAGYSTYDSIYRAKYVFDVKKMVIVTQEYHVYRALYIAERFGINAYGVGAKDVQSQVLHNNVREIFARDKDFVTCILKPEAEVSGDKISLSGDGDDTNDK